MSLTEDIQVRLSVLEPLSLSILDDSHLHAGHKGNSGGGHFTVHIVSSHFSGKSHIIRHRVVYQALGDLIPGKIHALSIRALAPEEQA